MSSNSLYKSKVKDIETLKKVLKDKGISFKETTKVRMYGGNKVTDAVLSFHLPGWRYPCAVREDGGIIYDHYGSPQHTIGQLQNLVFSYNKQATVDKAMGTGRVCNWFEQEVDEESMELVFEF